MTPLPIAIYARYSTDKQDARSIDDQVRRCREHAAAKGFEVIAEFSDAAVSGTHTERAQLRRMLDVATATKRPPFKAVLVDDLSRLSRDVADTHSIIAELASVGVRLLDVSVGLDSEREDAELTIGMHALINSQYVRAIGKQTHRGLDGRARGGFSTGGSLFGYTTRPEPNPSDLEHPRMLWDINEAEALIVRRIFRDFADGAAGYAAIADALNREGIPSPRNAGRGGKHGKGWCHTTVRAILGNAKYIGEWTWNTHKWTRVPGRRARRRRMRPESEHVTKHQPELAIIDRVLWDRVQARMRRHKPGTGTTTRKGQTPYLISGLLRCGTCGGPMSVCGQRTKNGVRYAQLGCTANTTRGGSICTNGATISERKVTAALVEALREVLTGPEVQAAFARAFERRVAQRTEKRDASGLEKLLADARRRVANATWLVAEDPDDLDMRRQREQDRAEVRRLESEIAAMAREAPRALPPTAEIGVAVEHFLTAVTTGRPAQGREMLASVLDGPLVLTPNAEGPDRYRAIGTLDAAKVIAAGSSGGMLGSLIYRISKVKSWTRTLVPYARG